jgi:heme-degrading monooxygenase HmoA
VTDAFVVVSELTVDPAGAAALEGAFRDRLGLAESQPGFRHLEVWRNERGDGAYAMVTWWDDEASFRAYMTSPAHAASHARVPVAPAKARGVGLRRYRRVAE